MNLSFQEFLDVVGVELGDFKPFYAYSEKTDILRIVLKDCSYLEEEVPHFIIIRNAHNWYEVVGLIIPRVSERKVSEQVLQLLNIDKDLKESIRNLMV